MLWYCILAAVLVLIDQATKLWAATALREQAIVIWENVFELCYRENTGIAFSLLENQRWIFIPMTLLVMVLVVVLMLRSEWRYNRLFMLSMAMILAGGVGNLIDRFWHGYVVDFLYFKLIDFPVFNFADCCVTVGAVLLFIYLLFIYRDTDEKPLRTVMFGMPQKAKRNGTDEQ